VQFLTRNLVGLLHEAVEQQGRAAGCRRVVPSGGSRVHVLDIRWEDVKKAALLGNGSSPVLPRISTLAP
jgi:hypothetical protein